MSTRFAGRVALVTGGGSGIGRAVAQALAREGATVVVTGRREPPLAETVALIEAGGGRAEAIRADVTSEDDVRAAVAAAERLGGLHVAVNNAGLLDAVGPLDEVDEPAWGRLVDTNLTGVWRSMKHEMAAMRRGGGGAIVNVASNVGAHLRLPYVAAYAATKAGVSVLTRAAAREAIGAGIRINAVSPGPVDTPMSLLPGEDEEQRSERMRDALPAGRVASVDEIAGPVLWLAAPESAFVVGHDLVVDGGASA